MASVYRHPDEFDPIPDMIFDNGRYDHAATTAAEDAWTQRLADWCQARHKGDLVGKCVYFPIADGAAQYMVMSHKPLALIHLPLGDAWSIPAAHAHGLRLSDLRQQVR